MQVSITSPSNRVARRICDAVVGDRDGVGLSVGALVGDEEEARSRRGPGRGGHHEASRSSRPNFARCSAARSAAFVCILDGRLDPWKGQVGGIEHDRS